MITIRRGAIAELFVVLFSISVKDTNLFERLVYSKCNYNSSQYLLAAKLLYHPIAVAASVQSLDAWYSSRAISWKSFFMFAYLVITNFAVLVKNQRCKVINILRLALLTKGKSYILLFLKCKIVWSRRRIRCHVLCLWCALCCRTSSFEPFIKQRHVDSKKKNTAPLDGGSIVIGFLYCCF